MIRGITSGVSPQRNHSWDGRSEGPWQRTAYRPGSVGHVTYPLFGTLSSVGHLSRIEAETLKEEREVGKTLESQSRS